MSSIPVHYINHEHTAPGPVADNWMSSKKTMNGGMNAALMECGMISCSFGRDAARRVFEAIFHVPFDTLHICYEGSRCCFFLPPSVLGYTHMPVCLDFRHDLSHSIIPQHYWQPITGTNFGRYVTGAKLENPIFLDHLNGGGFGLTVAEACSGASTHIRRWHEVAELGGKATMQVRVWVLHTDVWKRQISTRDQTLHKKAITLRQFVRHLGTTMRNYLKSHPLYSETGQLITIDDLIILAAVHVSAGSWQLIVACRLGKVHLAG